MRAILEQMLERFGSNGLGHTPGRFHTSVHRINLPLTVFSISKSILNHSEAPPAVYSPESYGSGAWEVGVGSTSSPWRRLLPPAYPHQRPPFATTAAPTALAHAPGHPQDVSGACSALVFCPALARSSPPPPLARHRPPSTAACNDAAERS